MAALPALAASWTGRLVDYSCIQRHTGSNCEPSRLTTKFAIQTADGAVHPLDPTGNAKTAEMMHDITTRSGDVQATISGDTDSGIIRVDNIEIQEIHK